MTAAYTSPRNEDDAEGVFVVEYANPYGYLTSQAWKIFAAFAAVIVILVLLQPYGDLDIQQRAAAGRGSRTSWSAGWSIILGIAAIALAIDFGMLAKRVLAGLPALVIDEAGLIGYWWGWPVEIAFSDVDQVVPEEKWLTIYARPGRLFDWSPNPDHAGSRFDHRARIQVPLDHVDKSSHSIIAALSRQLPANRRGPQSSFSR